MENLDIYGVSKSSDGDFYITKNGEYYLHCVGDESSAKDIATLLNDDCKRQREEKIKNGQV